MKVGNSRCLFPLIRVMPGTCPSDTLHMDRWNPPRAQETSRNIKKPFCHRQVRYRVGRFRWSKDLDSISNFQPTLTKIEVLTQCQAPTWITPPREPVRPKILSTSSDDLWTAAAWTPNGLSGRDPKSWSFSVSKHPFLLCLGIYHCEPYPHTRSYFWE